MRVVAHPSPLTHPQTPKTRPTGCRPIRGGLQPTTDRCKEMRQLLERSKGWHSRPERGRHQGRTPHHCYRNEQGTSLASSGRCHWPKQPSNRLVQARDASVRYLQNTLPRFCPNSATQGRSSCTMDAEPSPFWQSALTRTPAGCAQQRSPDALNHAPKFVSLAILLFAGHHLRSDHALGFAPV